ncbi:hypothetical protein CHCC14819_0469 [Bacillus licheniformis]|nr:hypothetical protein CHCC14819_0469 [Bacillus licheniformis]
MIMFKEREPEVVAYCACCGEAFTEQDVFLDYGGDYLCDAYCLLNYADVKEVEGSDLK